MLFWDHLPNKLPVHKSLSQGLLWGSLKLRCLTSTLLHESTPFLVLSTLMHPLMTSLLYLCFCLLLPFVLLSVILLARKGSEEIHVLA